MRQKKLRMKGHDAVSPVIGTLLILAIFTASAATIIGVVRPQVVDYQERGKVDTVVTHMTAAAAELRQLAVSGNPSEVRQPIIDLPGGTFQLDGGHLVALGIGYYSNASASSQTTQKQIGDYHRFVVGPSDLEFIGGANYLPAVDPSDRAVNVTFYHGDYTGSAFTFSTQVSYWDGEDWVRTTTSASSLQSGQWFPVVLEGPAAAPTAALSDHMWRFEYYNQSTVPPSLVGQTYLYQETGMTFRFDGESGPRYVYGENGAVFRDHDGRMQLAARGLITPPVVDYGNDLFTLRNIRMTTIGAGSAGGNVDVGLLMRVTGTEAFVFDGGASHVRVQYWGHHPNAWENHLINEGFVKDAVSGAGVYWGNEQTAGFHKSFPVNMIDTVVDVRVQSV